jgi:[glutamine synthetase] adenylyltransferase / [glutamine synthetase]-adenylyl-L-tyrosine phosphorylase
MAADPDARRALASLLPGVLEAAGASADPDEALSRFERFVGAAGSASRTFSHLRADPRMTDVLLRCFGASPFLAEVLIRHPGWMYWLSEPGVLTRARTGREVAADLRAATASLETPERRRAALRVAKRREALHAGVRDTLRLAGVAETLLALSDAADALIEAALLAARAEVPGAPGAFVVLGFGKLGGRELNFSSDVDLVYVYDGDEAAAEALARALTRALHDVTEDGHVHRVDLRLRPEGGAGRVAIPAAAFTAYYPARGATWERLALLKARPVAGDLELGRRCLEETAPFVFGRPFDAAAREDVRAIKRRIDARLAARSETARHVKLGRGGIREIELVAQVQQLRFGAQQAALRARGTVEALDALHVLGVLAQPAHRALTDAYAFLRDVENKLQMVGDAQVHVLPRDEDELRRLALRIDLRDHGGRTAADALRAAYAHHTEAVHRAFEQVVG